MFTELKIKNFQSLKDVTLKLGKITVIIGPSYLGKSAVVRAIHTLVHNRFNSSYMTQGATSTSIELREDDKWVRYNRGANSSYQFSENPEAYTKIGREVPQEIREFIGMDEIIFDQDLTLDFNIARQFDNPFIIGLSGFEAAKVFGKMMNLDIVLSASRIISKDIQSFNKEMDACQAVVDVSISYIQEHYSDQLKYSLLQEAISLEEEVEKEEDELEELLSVIAGIITLEYNEDILTKLMDSDAIRSVSSIEDPPKELQSVIINYLYSEQQLQAYLPLEETMRDFKEFEFDVYARTESLIVSSELINTTFLSYGQMYKKLKSADLSAAEELANIVPVIQTGDRVNTAFKNYVGEHKKTSLSLKEKQEEFSKYINEHNICPYTHKPMSQECIKAIQEVE